jgi:cysteine desulfurase/selenocysteine lyase
MTLDIEALRRDTPGCAHVAHFNNAGAGLMPRPVLDAMIAHLRLESEIGGYEAAAREANKIDRVYDAAARLLNCARDEIAHVENATVAWDMAFYALRFEPGDRILTSMAEYASNFIPYLQRAQQTGVAIDVVPNDENGQIAIDALRARIDERVKLISITHVPTSGGLVNPIAEVGAVARRAGIPFLVDACQSVGHMPIDVAAIGCDMLSTTGRKYLRGPRGTGLLYVRREMIETLEPPFLDLFSAEWTGRDSYTIRSDARRFENWENNLAAKIGLGVALDYAHDLDPAATYARIRMLAGMLREELATIAGVTVTDTGTEQCGIVTFANPKLEPVAIMDALRPEGINVHRSHQPSTRLDMEARGLEKLTRCSVHYYNNEDEVDRLLTALRKLLA